MSFDPTLFSAYPPPFVVYYSEIKYYDSANALATFRDILKPTGTMPLESSLYGDEGIRLGSEAAWAAARADVARLVAGNFVNINGVPVNRDRVYSAEAKSFPVEYDETTGTFIPA